MAEAVWGLAGPDTGLWSWWTRATILAGLFGVTFAGMKLFTDCLRTGFLRFLELLFTKPETTTTVDPSAAQGRSGRVG